MFDFLKRKKNKEEVPKPIKEKTFTFSTLEAAKIGDKYEYTVKADSREEAFEKLVRWFFEKDSLVNHNDVEQKRYDVTYKYENVFQVEGMPYWFGKRISGNVRDKDIDYQLKLIEYARNHGITLNND